MIKETYYTFKVVYDLGYTLEDKWINIKSNGLLQAYNKMLEICSKEIGIDTVKVIEYKGTDTFELYE